MVFLSRNVFNCKSQGRDQNICLWDLAEGRATVTDVVCTENVGFCKCSPLEVAEGRWLIATAWRNLEEVGSFLCFVTRTRCIFGMLSFHKVDVPKCGNISAK